MYRALFRGPVLRPVIGLRGLHIQAQDTPNPRSLKFSLDRAVLEGQGITYDFQSQSQASGSPLAAKLFEVNGVVGVFLASDFISVTLNEETEWSDMESLVSANIEEFFDSGDPVLAPVSENETKEAISEEPDDEVTLLIKELIDTRIRPSVQEDGGDIAFRGFVNGIVKLQMQGSCVGCPSSDATLKHGIQNMLMHYIPEVLGVEAYDDVEPEVHTESDRILADLESKIRVRKR